MEKEKGTISTSDLVNSGVNDSEDRGKWGSKADFLLSCLGYAVGLGNVWRFPYLCYENGGGAFLIPYAIMLVFAGLPVFFMEVSLGQYSSSGPATAWKISPMFRGIGYGMILVSALVGIYYNVIIMYALYYMFASMRKTLPWTDCDNSWNTDYCYGRYTDCIDLGDSIVNDNNRCVNVSMLSQNQREHYNVTYDSNTGTANLSEYTDPFASQRVLASEEYYRNKVLRESDSIGELGGVVWHLFGCLIGAWVIVFLCLVRGIKSSGKVVYFTATFPYVVLLILLVRGLTLEGYQKGIEFFITPNWDKLSEAKVWKDAAIQIFYSLSAAWGGLLTLSSYNKFHNNCYFDALFVSIANCCTSIFAGFVIFSILGYMAHELGREVDEVVDQGFSLAFIAYPEALARMPAAPLWAILFFAMLVTLGLDSQFTILETVVTSITDTFPGLRKRKTLVLLVSCLTMFCISIICVTEAGIYWVNLLDSYSASFTLLTFAMTECIVISWIYGVARFRNDIRTMIGDSWVDFPLFNYWIAAWAVLTPGLLLAVQLYDWIKWSAPTYNGPFPTWANAIGWVIIVSTLILTPIFMLIEYSRASGTFFEGDKVSLTSVGDENPNRGNWSNKCDFVLSCLGYAVGLGNVWRFPYLAYSNGGGAFLVPYAIMLFFAGMPIFFFEVCLGQYSSQGPISVWKASPMFRGIGFGMVIASAFVGIYYNVIITYAIYYMFASFTKDLPWESCGHDFNTVNCTLKYTDCLAQEGKIMLTTTCQNITDLGDEQLRQLNIFKENDIWNTSLYVDSYAKYRKRPTEEYWKHGVLQESESMNETGGIVWELALCLLLAWILVFLCLAKGVKSSGKVVYFTATFPYAVLLALLIRGVTLDGAEDGIDFFIKPVWDDITTPQVWLDAATQIFFSLSAAWGGLVTLSSYNRFHNNGYFDSVFVSLANCATSVFAGFAIFSVLGHVALEQNKAVPDVVDSGFGLAFIAYPEGLSLLPGSTFWAIIFFLMLITLGLDSQFVIIETVVTAICDGCPSYLRKRKTLVTLVVCILGYVLGLVCVTRSGAYWVSLVDSYAPSIGLIMFGLLELVAISWVYGIKRFTNDIRSMLGDSLLYKFPFFFWWQLNWTVITPSLLLFVLLYNWMNWSEPTYNDELYPLWGRVIGWVIIGLTIVFIPLVMIYEFLRANGSVADRWRAMSRPRAEWGPQMEANRAQAWQMHEYYNTTMGGKREAPDTSR